MNIAICDDEEKYIKDIKACLVEYEKNNNIEFNIFEFTSGRELVDFDMSFDIAFLDIEIGDVDGIEIGRTLKAKNENIVLICVTAYNHYLDDALDIGIVRFFDKPINHDRFMKGIKKAVSIVDDAEIDIKLKDEDKNINIVRCRDIIYVEITGRSTTVHTTKGNFKSSDSIKNWEERLNKSYFISPHKSFLINSNYITFYSREYIVLAKKFQIPVSYSKRSEFRQKVMKIMENY